MLATTLDMILSMCPYMYVLQYMQSTLRPTLYRKTGNYIHSGNTTQIYTDRVTAQPQSHAHYYIWSACCIIVALSLNIAAVWIFFSFQGLITRSAWTVSTPRWSHVFSLWYGPWKSLQLDSEMPVTDLRKIQSPSQTELCE